MSLRTERVMDLAGFDAAIASPTELHQHFRMVLKQGLFGMCFSPYTEGQQPGMALSEDQIRRRIEVIRPYTQWVRSFSCTEGNELIPQIAKEYGMKTLVGAWLDSDKATNEKELEGLFRLAREGWVDVAAVGNEVLYRGELSENELLDYIERAKRELPDTQVGYVDAYYEFENRPKLAEVCDVLLANCYPFWEGCPSEYAFLYMKDMYHRTVRVAGGKPVMITETGWPSQGQSFHGAHPSNESAMQYFINAQTWSKEEGVPMFYFSSFDESWKTGDEGDVGAYWGLWDKNEQLKY